jgi:GGDEF domain-containing protein
MPKRDSGPLLGAAAEDRFYSTRLRQLMRIDLDEPAARLLWTEVSRHREELSRRLRRDVGQRVALLDYVVNVSPQATEPQIIERDTLETIERRAIVDPLTGLFNREYFDLALPRETERCKRSGVHAALVLMDLDRFKSVNDSHGHRKGDDVLRTVGGIVREQVRAVDIPCRFGGDELGDPHRHRGGGGDADRRADPRGRGGDVRQRADRGHGQPRSRPAGRAGRRAAGSVPPRGSRPLRRETCRGQPGSD